MPFLQNKIRKFTKIAQLSSKIKTITQQMNTKVILRLLKSETDVARGWPI